MIIENGYIQIKKQEGGGLLNGIPQPIKERWCEPIPCNIRKNKSDHRGTYIDGKFIDPPIVGRAQRTLDLYQAIEHKRSLKRR